MKKYVTYCRVSTQKQGVSGLGLEAQINLINYFVQANKGEIIQNYSEVYTGKDLAGCMELRKAIAQCKTTGATLIIAKTDRFRNVMEALSVLDELDGQIMFCDLPNTDRFTLTLFFAIAEREALIVSIRTKQALEEKRARGEVMGGSNETWCKHSNLTDHEKELYRSELGSRGGKEAGANRRQNALSNTNNTAFKYFVEDWVKIHGAINKQTNWGEMVMELNKRGMQTATGMEYDEPRAKAMYQKTNKMYQAVS